MFSNNRKLLFSMAIALPALLAVAAVVAATEAEVPAPPAPPTEVTPPAPPAPPALPAPASPVSVVPASMPAPPAPLAARAPHDPDHRIHRRVEIIGSDGAWLGVVLGGDRKVKIREVMEDSPAEKAGLEADDEILEIDGRKVERTGDVTRTIHRKDPGDTIEIMVDRDGREESFRVTLGEWPEHKRQFNFQFGEGDDEGRVIVIGAHGGLYMGVELHQMSEELRGYFNAPRRTGLLVNRVVEDSPAEQAGIQAGDVIVEVDGREVRRVGDISRALRDHEAGDTIPVRIIRDRSEQTLDINVDERPHGKQRGMLHFLSEDGEFPHFNWSDHGSGYAFGWSDEDREALERTMEEVREKLQKSMENLRIEMKDQQREMRHLNREMLKKQQEEKEKALTRVRESVSYDI